MEKFERYVLRIRAGKSSELYGSHRNKGGEITDESFKDYFDDTCFLQAPELSDLYQEAIKRGYGSITVYPILLGEALKPEEVRAIRRAQLIAEKELTHDQLVVLGAEMPRSK